MPQVRGRRIQVVANLFIRVTRSGRLIRFGSEQQVAYEIKAFVSEETVMLDAPDLIVQGNSQTGLLSHLSGKRKLRRFSRLYTAAGQAVSSLRIERFREGQYLSAGPGQDHYDLAVGCGVSP